MDIRIIYEDKDLLVADKPSNLSVFSESAEQTLISLLLEKYPELKNVGEAPRYGIIHRLDKDTSGAILIAKSNDSLAFFQKQFKDREIEKRYIALASGNIKEEEGIIESLIGRSPQNKLKQKAYSESDPRLKNRRKAVTEYRVMERFKEYALLEVLPKTGRKHQIRCHLAYINHPIAGDKLYGFKNQPCPEGLERQFLHAESIKVKMRTGELKEFESPLAKDLAKTLEKLRKIE